MIQDRLSPSRPMLRNRAQTETPYAGITVPKLVFLFVIGCFAGFLLESVYCLVTKGYIESRQGMIYGPFNQVYGFGMVLMVLLLTPLARKGDGTLFLGSALVGGTFEFLCSWLQERVIGTVSWEYSNEPFSFGGRTTLVFMVYWGIGGLLVMRYIYPWIARQLDRIPLAWHKRLAGVLAVLFAVNMLVSLAAVMRWHGRIGGEPAETAVHAFLDTHYPDDRLADIYPNMIRTGATAKSR